MEKKDLDLKTKRFKTAERRQKESENDKELRQESDRLRIAKKRELTANLNIETKRRKEEEKRKLTDKKYNSSVFFAVDNQL